MQCKESTTQDSLFGLLCCVLLLTVQIDNLTTGSRSEDPLVVLGVMAVRGKTERRSYNKQASDSM